MSEPRATYNAVKLAGDATRQEQNATRDAVNDLLEAINNMNSPDRKEYFWRIVMQQAYERLHELFR